jgi:SWI/SNF-related matrix-associated actin-dependent regulator of chromatin subfamily A3
MQLYCHTTVELPCTTKKPQKGKRRGKGSQSWSLNIILYGPTALADTIGEFFSGHQIYLQDPLGCERRVLYRNPHIVKPEIEDEVMTDVFDASYGNLGVERLEIGPDLLAQLMEDAVPLPETDAPAIVTTELFPYINLPSHNIKHIY